MKKTAAEAQRHRADLLKLHRRRSPLRLCACAAGFTLIEVLVALVVTVAALGIIAQGLTTGARASVISQNATRAAMLAQQVVAGLETGEIALGTSAAEVFEDDPDFSYETLSSTDPDNAGLNYVTITIKWTEREQDRTYVLTRLMKDRPSTSSSSNP